MPVELFPSQAARLLRKREKGRVRLMVASSLLAVIRQVDTARGATDPNPGSVAVFNRFALSLAEFSDRPGIQQLLVDYATAIDNRRFDLDKVVTPDAYIDL
jgi:hypothetical protein